MEFSSLSALPKYFLNGCFRVGGVGGVNRESSIEIYTLPCVKQIASGKLLCNIGSSAWCSVTPRGVRWGM